MSDQQMELAVKMIEGNAGALDFVRGLINEDGGWDLLERIDAEKPDARGSVLFARTRNAGQVMALQPAGSIDLTFSEIARRVLA